MAIHLNCDSSGRLTDKDAEGHVIRAHNPTTAETHFTQGLVDPNAVALEYHEAAEKRRAEQLEQFACRRRADAANVLRRDRAACIIQCLAEINEKPAKTVDQQKEYCQFRELVQKARPIASCLTHRSWLSVYADIRGPACLKRAKSKMAGLT